MEIAGCKQIFVTLETATTPRLIFNPLLPSPFCIFPHHSSEVVVHFIIIQIMDGSPLAQLNNRQQQQFVISPIEDVSSLWDAPQQRQQIRPNPLQRGPFARSYNSSFGSFSSTSSSSNYTTATSISSSGTGCIGMSANLSLDPR